MPSRKRLQRIFFYSPSTGVLYWRRRRPGTKSSNVFNAKFALKAAGTLQVQGYLSVEIAGSAFKVHRIIWKLMTGKDPEWIDHKDRDRSNNRWPNLRNASQSQNGYNGNLSPRNTSGYRGVSFIKAHGKYRAAVQIDGRKQHIGYFRTAEAARAAASSAILATRGEFARLD